MELLFNDLSVDGQFPDVSSFIAAVGRVMIMRQSAQRFGREVYCHRKLSHAKVTQELTVPQAVQKMKQTERSAFMQWLTRNGPFWEDDQIHGPNDYLECQKQIVTDTAIGEAASRRFQGADYRMVSLTPSDWTDPLLTVWWKDTHSEDRSIQVKNYVTAQDLEKALLHTSKPADSWECLASNCQRRFQNLTFLSKSFESLQGHPFVKSAALRIEVLLNVLDRMKNSFDEHGNRTDDGHRLYQIYFTGKEPRFSDSSDTEKGAFKAEMTFKHPDASDGILECTWHGKVQTPQLRIHFSWPISAKTPLYVAYVGPKITKK